MSAPALELVAVSKRYAVGGSSPVVAVDNVSFQVQAGQVVALLGPNGAGKTTAMQLALALLDRDAGEVRLFGEDPELLEVRRRVGFAPDAPLFPRRLTGLEVLELHAALLGLDRAQARSRAVALLDQLGIAEAGRRPCSGYSRGQGQRLGLASALLGEPELLLLDEPTAGLDPAGVAAMRELLSGLRARGAAVLLNSHLLSEVEKVCDVALFMKDGKLLHRHAVAESAHRAEVRVANLEALRVKVSQLLPDARMSGDRLSVAVQSASAMPALVKLLDEAGAQIIEAKMEGAMLERLYLEIVEGKGALAAQGTV